jgi:hypothetical protein
MEKPFITAPGSVFNGLGSVNFDECTARRWLCLLLTVAAIIRHASSALLPQQV